MFGGFATILIGMFALSYMFSNLNKIRDPDFSIYAMSETSIDLSEMGEVPFDDTHMKVFFVLTKHNKSDPIFIKDGLDRYLNI